MSTRWAVAVPPLPDELLSSWLVRAALAQGCEPLVLTGFLWPDWRAWTRDPDRGLTPDRLLALVRAAGIEPLTLEMASLRPTAAAITKAPLDRLGIWPWVLAQGTRNRKRHGGLQYCSCCLEGDRKPYYRRQWRLAWHTGCPTHGAMLRDRCPVCNAPVAPHCLTAEAPDLATCSTCKHDLRKASTVVFTPAALAFQQAADDALVTGRSLYGTQQLATRDWFELSRYFVILLQKVALMKTKQLASFASQLGLAAEGLKPSATGLSLELLPVEERAQLLCATWTVLCAGPDHFLRSARGASLTRASLSDQRQPPSASIAKLIESLPEGGWQRKRRAQVTTHTPTSRRVVMRMFARLQRKMDATA